jgi:hypothetical protein
VFERVLLAGGDVRLGVLSAHASSWTFGFPLCGNGVLDAGEACDPPGGPGGSQCLPGQSCKSDCSCAANCNCCAGGPTTLTISHVPASGTCGSAGLTKNLTCGSLYFGGAAVIIPEVLLAENTSVMAVTACTPATETLTLGPTTALDTGNAGTCTAAGCRFGAPMAIPNPASTPTSMCVVITRPAAASGTVTCGGLTSIAMPLSATLHLTGDTGDPMQTIPGIQPCPLCSGGTCTGGPNAGLACTAETSAINAGYPTSSDCPPSPALSLGSFPIGATLTTGTVFAVAGPGGFCGYCRDLAPPSATGAYAMPAFECDSAAECAPVSPTYEACIQRTFGAFGTGTSLITLSGAVPGCLADGLAHPATAAAGFCIAPTFGPTLDIAADLPGPGAFTLKGTFQLQ